MSARTKATPAILGDARAAKVGSCGDHTAPLKADKPVGFVKLPNDLLARRDLRLATKVLLAVVRDQMRSRATVTIGERQLAEIMGFATTKPVLASIGKAESALELVVVRNGNGQRSTYRLPSKTVTQRGTVSTPHRGAKRHPTGDGDCHPTGYGSVTQRETRPDSDFSQTTAAPYGDGGGARTGERNGPRELVRYFGAAWAKRFGAKYPFDREKDAPAATRILEAVGGDVERAKQLIDAYLRDADDWTRKRGCGLSLLASKSQLPRCLAAVAATPSPARTVGQNPDHRRALAALDASGPDRLATAWRSVRENYFARPGDLDRLLRDHGLVEPDPLVLAHRSAMVARLLVDALPEPAPTRAVS